MSNERDELADLIEDAVDDAIYNAADAPPSLTGIVATRAADAVLGAGWRPPARLVYTVEELDALPEGSVIRTAGYGGQYAPRIAEKNDVALGISYWQVANDDSIDVTSDELDDLPAEVIHEPVQP